ncbi:MAG: hypothetical protein JWR69_1480, partial [Pedosphaera sp.]|nr:hypothetical protein [Pedosphaera sp.]
APSSEMPGPNRAASIRRASRNAGQALSGRNCLREPSGGLGRSGAFSSVVRSLMRILVEQTNLRRQENLPPQTHPRDQHLGPAPSAYLNIRYALFFSASKRRNLNWSRRELTDRNNRTQSWESCVNSSQILKREWDADGSLSHQTSRTFSNWVRLRGLLAVTKATSSRRTPPISG